MQLRVVVHDGQRLLREGMALFLGGEPDVELVATAESSGELARLCELHRPDAVVLAMDADEFDACRLAIALRKRQRGLRVVGLCDEVSRVTAQQATQAGVHAVVVRSDGMTMVLAAIRAKSRLAPKIIGLPDRAEPEPKVGLTSRERSVLQLIRVGSTTREISEVLGISPKTVENHKRRIFTKLGVQNQAHAVSVAMRSGMLPVDTHAG